MGVTAGGEGTEIKTEVAKLKNNAAVDNNGIQRTQPLPSLTYQTIILKSKMEK